MTSPEMPTWIACLTPPGQAALATLGLHGPRAWEVLRRLFRRRSGNQLPPEPTGGRFWLGQLGEEMADEVVVAVKRAEPVPWLEVHSHGGREVVHFLIELFREQGMQLCVWEDFVSQTDEDALSAQAAVALAQATTLRTASILLDQQQGALAQALESIRHDLESGEVMAAQKGLERLARRASVGQHLTQPWLAVVAGAPNVGKSSLVNALAGYQRSIVAATPGTTRDVVRTGLALDGWSIELADTAGQRSTEEPLEAQGASRARAAAAAADLCLWLLDGSSPPVWPSEIMSALLYVINKSDLPSAWDAASVSNAVRVSALTGQGLTELCAGVVSRLVPEPPPPGAAVPFASYLCAGIAEAQGLLGSGDVVPAHRVVTALRAGRS